MKRLLLVAGMTLVGVLAGCQDTPQPPAPSGPPQGMPAPKAEPKTAEPSPAATKSAEPKAAEPKAGDAKAAAPGQPGEAKTSALPNEYCPVMPQHKAKAAHHIEYQGRTIYFCCDDCPAKFKKDPAKYLAVLDANK